MLWIGLRLISAAVLDGKYPAICDYIYMFLIGFDCCNPSSDRVYVPLNIDPLVEIRTNTDESLFFLGALRV